MTPDARRHARGMAALLHPAAERLDRRFKRILRERSYNDDIVRAICAITPGAAAQCKTFAVFLESVGYHGRRLAKLNIAPDEVLQALKDFGALMDTVLAGRFQPVREQIDLAIRLALNEAYYQVREAETQALFGIYRAETDAEDFDSLLRRLVGVLTTALRARSGRLIELEQPLSRELSEPRYILRGSTHESLIADAKMRGRHASYWSYPLAERLVAQFGFATPYPWLPRELVLLEAAAERCRAAIERRRLEAAALRLAAEKHRAEEEERRRIGRELHDEAGQSLVFLRLQLELIERDAPPAVRHRITASREVVESAIVEIRRILSALGPQVVERLGLIAALRQLGARFAKMHSAEIQMRIPQSIPAHDPAVAEAIYRAAQESLLNIAKHSSAKRVKVSLRTADSMIKLSVSDDGFGFSENAALKPQSFGLTGMRERAALLGGKFETVSAPGKGVTVKLEVPLAATPIN
jgi:signal transduction histidine kinase